MATGAMPLDNGRRVEEGESCGGRREAIWQGERSRALGSIRQALDALSGGRAPQRYAAL
ncbi:hypothetical protein [Amycolatopsis sp. NBC_01480]|uniref:hypothetical protein n=1 Tax=Amycolatopsis sp. NBC_01480 TaxID=2903562 RepID=UPI002E2C4493|nr:hypothetical protein [Amycolatopsis sp. NBC_01480]